MYQLNDSPYIVHCKNHDIKDTVNESGELIGFDILIQMNIYTCLEKHISDNDITLSEQEIIKLARNIGGALSDAHELGIIHRDIKPENIFLDKHNNYLLGDFGVSKQMQTNNYSTIAGTQPSSIVVTKATSAPKTPSTDQTYKFMMPDLTGHSLDEITEQYDGILEFDIHYARHTQHPDGIIFYQEPKADTIVTEGDVISISVSGVAVEDNETSDQSWWITSEAANIVLPAFVSRKYTYVYQQYSDMFAFMPVYEFSDEYEPDTIMTQDIPASTLVERGTIIKLTISLGPKPH